MFSLLTQFSGNLQWNTSERNEACGDKGNILRCKVERSFRRNFLVMCVFISQSYTYVSWSSPLTLSLRNLRRAYLDRIEAYADKGNIIGSERERSFLRNCIARCECNSQSYTFLFSVQCANTVFWKSVKGYFWTQWSLRWQRKCPQMKTRGKLC